MNTVSTEVDHGRHQAALLRLFPATIMSGSVMQLIPDV